MKKDFTKAKQIVSIVAETFGVAESAIMAKKKAHTNDPKVATIALIEQHTNIGHEGIMEMFNMKSRGNIYAARKRTADVLKKNRKTFNKFRAAEAKIIGVSTPIPAQKVEITEEQALAALQSSKNYRYEVFRYEKKQII